MKLYRLLTGPDDANFCQRVTDALYSGWKLHGGPALTHDGKTVIAAQAIVKTKQGKYSPKVDLKSA